MISAIALMTAAGLGVAPQTTNPDVWLRAAEYPRDGVGRLDHPEVRIEMIIDLEGEPIGCSVVNSVGTRLLDEIFCKVPMARAHFKAARDEDGRPIVGIVSRNFYSRRNQGTGPVWNDYTLTVSRIEGRTKPISLLRIVTGSDGKVESCAVQASSGSESLDRLACSYSRARIALAPPLDAAGRPVRALRIVSVGFTTGAAPASN